MSETTLRHTLRVRITHWINAAAFIALLVSGIGILIAHPQFYWGETGYFGMEPWLAMWFEPNVGHTSWGRNVHFLFAWLFVGNGAIYVLTGLVSGHFYRRLVRSSVQPDRANISGGAYRRPQKILYLVVIFLLGPLILLSGMTMSPGFVTAMPELTDLFGGRQSARSVHFICASMLVGFLVVHLIQVARSGPRRLLRAMLTGSLDPSRASP